MSESDALPKVSVLKGIWEDERIWEDEWFMVDCDCMASWCDDCSGCRIVG